MKRQPFFAKSHCFLRVRKTGRYLPPSPCPGAAQRSGNQKRPETANIPFCRSAQKDRPCRTVLSCVITVGSQPAVAAEGHSMSILLLGFLG